MIPSLPFLAHRSQGFQSLYDSSVRLAVRLVNRISSVQHMSMKSIDTAPLSFFGARLKTEAATAMLILYPGMHSPLISKPSIYVSIYR